MKTGQFVFWLFLLVAGGIFNVVLNHVLERVY